MSTKLINCYSHNIYQVFFNNLSFLGKRLICCTTAHKSFQDIVALLGGPEEKRRAEELTKRVEILPDVTSIPPEISSIKFSGKINERSLLIFAFGMDMKAVTVTSNKAFIRSAKMQVSDTIFI